MKVFAPFFNGLLKKNACLFVVDKDLYQVQETWKFFFLTYIQLGLLTPVFMVSKFLPDGST